MNYFDIFIKTDQKKKLAAYREKGDKYWRELSEKSALELFREASHRIPAYADFLKKNKVDASKIKSVSDFEKVPTTDKENYIDKYPIKDLCWDGKVENSYFLSASSGSTGTPHYWPRSTEQTYQGATISELIYKEYFQADKKSTLYIVGFAMGTWIAGTYMMMSTIWVAEKGYPITVVTPGGNKDEILRLVKMGAENYDQVVLIGYPPFIKDVVDTGLAQGIDWKKMAIKFMFSGEAVTERWREHLYKTAGLKNIYTDTVNIYGSADVGLIAHETAVTTFVRKSAFENKDVLKDLFNSERIPSVNQYDPEIRYFERVGEELVITAPSGIPLIRYNTKDIGDVLYFEDAEVKMGAHGINISRDLGNKIGENLVWRLPMVYLFGRGKFTTVIYGANIYPEHVKLVLEHPSVEKRVTGKFVVSTEEKKDHTEELWVRVELGPKESKTDSKLKTALKDLFISEVSKVNSEYNYVLTHFGNKVHPKMILYEYGDAEYFPRGIIKKLA